LWPLTGWRKAPLIVAKIISSVKKGVYHTRRFQQGAQDDEMRRTLQDETTNGREHSNMTKILAASKVEPTGKTKIECRGSTRRIVISAFVIR
jgi:hypothetical protein